MSGETPISRSDPPPVFGWRELNERTPVIPPDGSSICEECDGYGTEFVMLHEDDPGRWEWCLACGGLGYRKDQP